MKLYWFNKLCCVPECCNTSAVGEGCFKEYFDLPAEPQARAKWLKAICTEDGENLKICDDHFTSADVFLDKNHRKKLRVNSVPSVKLPKNVCTTCLGATGKMCNSKDFDRKMCQCVPPSTALQQIQPLTPSGKRLTWTPEEKRTLFRAIQNCGDVKFGNNNIRINWPKVVTYCRDNGCFGNEKELKNVWQNLRINANKVYKNEIFGSKLERKVARFLHGMSSRRSKSGSTNVSTDDEEYNQKYGPVMMVVNSIEEGNVACVVDNPSDVNETVKSEEKPNESERVDMEITDDKGESDNEFLSISDVEELFNIKIPRQLPEVISLVSSDDD